VPDVACHVSSYEEHAALHTLNMCMLRIPKMCSIDEYLRILELAMNIMLSPARIVYTVPVHLRRGGGHWQP